MTHGHLSLDLTSGLERDADHDYDRSARESNAGDSVARDDVSGKRKNRDDTEEECAHKSYLIEDLRDVIGSRLTGADSGDEAAVLLQVV